jgi:hypothetical protein
VKVTICDVCDGKFEFDEEILRLEIPPGYMDNEEFLAVDICSWECLEIVIQGARGNKGVEPEKPKRPIAVRREEAPDKFIEPDAMPGVDLSEVDPKRLAEITEQMTGVRRRT